MSDITEKLRGYAPMLFDDRIAAADEIERLRRALKKVGDDYPGSSCQQWCYEQAGIPLSASPRCAALVLRRMSRSGLYQRRADYPCCYVQPQVTSNE